MNSKNKPLVLSRIDESFYRATAAVVAQVLERCGHPVTVIDGSHTEAYDALGRGDADLCVAFWLPYSHAKPWEKLQGLAVELTTLYEGARFFWAVLDEHAPSELRAIGDLSRPEIATLFPKQVRGLSLDATITTASMMAIEEYGLSALGFSLHPGSFNEWRESLKQASEAGTNVILPLWQPYHLNALYKLRRLEDPKGILGKTNHVALAARTGVPESLPPETIVALRTIGLTLDAVSEMDAEICVMGKTPEQAAAVWLESRGLK